MCLPPQRQIRLLLNFGTEYLEYKRFVYSANMDSPRSQSALSA